jgi:hypothetical protein
MVYDYRLDDRDLIPGRGKGLFHALSLYLLLQEGEEIHPYPLVKVPSYRYYKFQLKKSRQFSFLTTH